MLPDRVSNPGHLTYESGTLPDCATRPSETGVVRANECYSQHHVKRHNRDIFSIFFYVKVCCVFSLESPHRGESNEYTQYTIFNTKKEKRPKLFQISNGILFQGTQEGVRNSRGPEPSVLEPMKFYCTYCGPSFELLLMWGNTKIF